MRCSSTKPILLVSFHIIKFVNGALLYIKYQYSFKFTFIGNNQNLNYKSPKTSPVKRKYKIKSEGNYSSRSHKADIIKERKQKMLRIFDSVLEGKLL